MKNYLTQDGNGTYTLHEKANLHGGQRIELRDFAVHASKHEARVHVDGKVLTVKPVGFAADSAGIAGWNVEGMVVLSVSASSTLTQAQVEAMENTDWPVFAIKEGVQSYSENGGYVSFLVEPQSKNWRRAGRLAEYLCDAVTAR